MDAGIFYKNKKKSPERELAPGPNCNQGLKKMPYIFCLWDLNPHSFCAENIVPYNQAKHNSIYKSSLFPFCFTDLLSSQYRL